MDSHIYSEKMLNGLKMHLLDYKMHRYITYPKFVFLCGKAFDKDEYNDTNRGIVDRYISAKTDNLFIVLSEELWENSFGSNIDLLTFEEFLAEVSDAIVLFVESPGSFCELGAFAYADKLFSDKLIIVIDEKYEGDESFIITGPTAKAKKDGAKVIYAPLDGTGLLSCTSMRNIIDRIITDFSSKSAGINKRSPNKDENAVHVNTFIIELLELIRLLEPISRKDLLDIYKATKNFHNFKFIKKDGNDFHNEIKYDYIIKLLETVQIINVSGNIITSNGFKKVQPLMLNYSKKSHNKERNRLLCRKYRYGGFTK